MKIDIVGSFLPPESLMNARRQYADGTIGNEQMALIENEAIVNLVERQIAIGLVEITSGEYRRKYWDKDFYFGLDGINKKRYSSGRVYQTIETGADLADVAGSIGFSGSHPFFDDFIFLNEKSEGRALCRQTLPSPANLYFEALMEGENMSSYESSEALRGDIIEAYAATIKHLYELGCRRVQFDDTVCGWLCQNDFVKRILQSGIDLMALHEDVISLVNGSIASMPDDMEISLYLSGGDVVVPEWDVVALPDNIMPKIFSQVKVDRFFLPMADSNGYQYEILSHVPDGKGVALGVVEAHSPFHNNLDSVVGYVSYVKNRFPNLDFSVCPRTGFKLSSYAYRGLNYEVQWEKLALMTEIFGGV